MKLAFALSLITIVYNIIEGLISIHFGYSDETISLFGFGLDSFIEVISALGISHLVYRMLTNEVPKRDKLERLALKITGTSFYILTTGLIVTSIINIANLAQPKTTLVGIYVALASLITMYFLYQAKLRVGKQLQSEAIIADANCTKTCFYLSFVLLFASLVYEVFHIPFIDAAGSLAIAWFSFKEGNEAFEKANSSKLGCSSSCKGK